MAKPKENESDNLAPRDDGPPVENKPPEQPAPRDDGPPVYLVAEGKVVTTLRGPMGAFQEVYARDFVRGDADLGELLGLGSLVRKKS